MKKIFLLFILLASVNLYSNYNTPGTGKSWTLDSLVAYSSGNVTYSGGIYFVNDTLLLSQSDTLKVLTNATVKFAPVVTFTVFGTLIINPQDSVKFTSADTTQKFYEMRLDSTSDASRMRKMIFEYSFNGMRLLDTDPLIDSCTFRYNCQGNTSTTVPAINLFRANPVISNCKIYRNYKVGIGGGSNINNAPQIINNIIYENNIANGNVPQINLGASGTGTTLIKGNIIIGLYTNAGGIATLALGTLNIRIENNIIKKNRYGIAIANANTNAVITGNVIDSNNIQGNPALGGSGINFNGGSTIVAIVTRNIIRGNLWGITIQGTSKPNMGNLSNADTSDDGRNDIYGNGHLDSIIDLYNNTVDTIKAENNYWGTTIIDSVEAHIVHKFDNAALGFVDYLPILNSPLGISTSNEPIPALFSLWDAYPNPFNPGTRIKFEIPLQLGHALSKVKLSIYDVLGREVDVIVDSELMPGRHSAYWSAEGFASGVYFCVLESGDFKASKRLVLLK